MLIAQAEGIHPAMAAQEYDVIQGRAALKSQAALARFQTAGGRIKWLKRSDSEASAQFAHPQGGELIVTWTMDRARKMGLADKDNWKKQPGVMLSWRVVAEGIRAIYPACLNRMYLTDEVVDFEPVVMSDMRDVTPPVEQEGTATASDPRVAEIYQLLAAHVDSGLLPQDVCDKINAAIEAGEDNVAKLEKMLKRAGELSAEAAAKIEAGA
jgi:hypothetical protein